MAQLTVNGAELHYDDIAASSGDNDHQVVVWGHGLLYRADTYWPMIDRMPAYRHIAVDFRGHGRSAGVTTDATISRMADDTWALLNALNIGKFAYIGHSMGNAVGMRLACWHPEAVTAAVGVAGVPLTGMPESTREYSRALAAMCGDQEAFATALAQLLMHTITEDMKDTIRATSGSAALVTQGPLTSIAETELYLDDSADILPGLRQPWLFLIPANDITIPPDAQLATAKAVPGARALWLNGEGHAYHQERPREAAAYVQKFLNIAQKTSIEGDAGHSTGRLR